MTQPGKRCIFCGERGNITKQHILPDRIKHLVPRLVPYHSHQTERVFYNPDGTVCCREPAKKLSPGHLGNRRFRVVCLNCNTGWMKRAEEEAFEYAEPIILGRTLVLSAEAQQKLTTLAALIMCMVDLTDQPTSTITQADRAYIRETRQAPASWYLFLGRTDSPEWKTRYRHAAAISLTQGTVPNGQTSNSQSTVVAIGNLVLHLAMSQATPILVDADRYARLLGLARLPGAETIDTAKLPLHDTASMVVLSSTLTGWMNGS